MIVPQPRAEYCCTAPATGTCPPVPNEVLMRYFNDPSIVNPRQTWLLEVLPKRLFEALAGGPAEPAEG
jgi:hypothetical protein